MIALEEATKKDVLEGLRSTADWTLDAPLLLSHCSAKASSLASLFRGLLFDDLYLLLLLFNTDCFSQTNLSSSWSPYVTNPSITPDPWVAMVLEWAASITCSYIMYLTVLLSNSLHCTQTAYCRPFGAQLKPFLEMLSGPNNGGQSVSALQGGQSNSS